MKTIRRLSLIFPILLLACSSEPEPQQAPQAPQEAEMPAPSNHVLQTQMDQIDRARGLQDQMNQSVQDRVRQIDETTQTDPDDG